MSTPATTATAAEPKEKGGTSGHLARAVALHLAGKREEAVKQLQAASSSGKAPAEVYRAMGHIQFELEDFQQAEKSYRALVRLKPQYAMGWFNLAVSLERLGNWDQALEAFQGLLARAHAPGRSPGSGHRTSQAGRSQVRSVLFRTLPGTSRRTRRRTLRQGRRPANPRSCG